MSALRYIVHVYLSKIKLRPLEIYIHVHAFTHYKILAYDMYMVHFKSVFVIFPLIFLVLSIYSL